MTTVRVVMNRLPQMANALREAASQVVRQTAFAIESDISFGMTAPHSGRVYGNHQASAPGEMPAVDTSTLLGSLQVDAKPGETTASVYVTPEYALYLEYGAPGAGLAPRPFMEPAAEGRRREFVRLLSGLEERMR